MFKRNLTLILIFDAQHLIVKRWDIEKLFSGESRSNLHDSILDAPIASHVASKWQSTKHFLSW